MPGGGGSPAVSGEQGRPWQDRGARECPWQWRGCVREAGSSVSWAAEGRSADRGVRDGNLTPPGSGSRRSGTGVSAALVPAEGEPSASASQLLVLPAILGMPGWWECPHSASVFQAFPLSRACAPFFQGLD